MVLAKCPADNRGLNQRGSVGDLRWKLFFWSQLRLFFMFVEERYREEVKCRRINLSRLELVAILNPVLLEVARA